MSNQYAPALRIVIEIRLLENIKDEAEKKNERCGIRRLPDNKTHGIINIDIYNTE